PRAVVYWQDTGEAHRYDKPNLGREAQEHELGAPPAAGDRRAGRAPRQRAGPDDAQDVALADFDGVDAASGHATLEVACDRLDFRQLRHCVRSPATRCRI